MMHDDEGGSRPKKGERKRKGGGKETECGGEKEEKGIGGRRLLKRERGDRLIYGYMMFEPSLVYQRDQ